ncbi:MAG: serine hydrolase [Eubacteriales bacterium]|nr:serine hydrolase [Eubacteriales bacterium]
MFLKHSRLMLSIMLSVFILSTTPVFAMSETSTTATSDVNSITTIESTAPVPDAIPAALLDPTAIDWSAGNALTAANWPTLQQVEAKSTAFIVIDRLTGAVILAKDEKTPHYPASTTKILTALIALESLSLERPITASEAAVDLPWDASKAGFQMGETTTVRDVLAGLMLPSGNDAANMLAEAISGDMTTFALRMNARALELGATSTNMQNANGLHDELHQMSASDLAIITAKAMCYPVFRELVATPTYAMAATNIHPQNGWAIYTNSNIKLLLQDTANYRSTWIAHIDGVKTGTTNAAGQCLVTAATTMAGQELICVVLGVDPEDLEGNVVSYSRTLLDAAAATQTTGERLLVVDHTQPLEVPGTDWLAMPTRDLVLQKGIKDYPNLAWVWPDIASIKEDATAELQFQLQSQTVVAIPVQFIAKPSPLDQLLGTDDLATNDKTTSGAQSILDWPGLIPFLVTVGLLLGFLVIFNIGRVIGRRQILRAMARRNAQR